MKVDTVELRRVRMPLVEPWRTAYGVEHERDVLLERASGTHDDAPTEGWGESGAFAQPSYAPEWIDGAIDVLRTHLVPRVLNRAVAAADLASVTATIACNHKAKAALETAMLDAELRAAGVSLAVSLGAVRDRVPCGVAVWITEPVERL